MKRVFVDTSAFVAVLDPNDKNHAAAAETWEQLLDSEVEFVTSGYTLVETLAVLDRKFGIQAVDAFVRDTKDVFTDVYWTGHTEHYLAVGCMLARTTREGPSLVDCLSMLLMQTYHIGDVFVYDKHFEGKGYNLVGGPRAVGSDKTD